MSRQQQGSRRKIGHSGKVVDMIVSPSSSLSYLAHGWLGAVLQHAGMFAANRPLLQRNRGKAGDDILDAAQVTKLLGLRYRVVRHVGSGAVGQVWLVRDKRTLCHRVVKFCCNSNQIQELSGVGASLSLRHPGLIDVSRLRKIRRRRVHLVFHAASR